MVKYISGRSKLTAQTGLTSDRYRYLSVSESEPNLGDPLVGPSSYLGNPPPPGNQYIVISVDGYPGERYWIPNQGGIIPGSITIFDEGVQVGGLSSTTQLDFIGNSVVAEGIGGINPGYAVTITISPPGNDKEVLFKNSGDFATDARFTFDDGLLSAGDRITVGTGGTVITTTGIGSVGIGTTEPTAKLHLQGDLRLTGTIYDSNNQPGDTGNLLVKTVTDGILWVTPNSVQAGAGGTIGQIQFHNTAGLVDGADNFYFDYINSRVGIGSTQPTQLLDVLGVSTFSGGVFIDDLSVSGVSTFTGTIDANGNLDVDGQTELDNLNVSGLSTFASNVDINAALDVDGQTDLDVLNVSETASFTATTNNTLGNVNTGSVQLDGGAGIAKNLTVGQTIQATNLNITGIGTISEFDFGTGVFDNIEVTGISTLGNVKVDGSTIYTNSGTLTLDSQGNSVQVASSDRLVVNNTTQSTSKDNGAIVVEGGVGIEKNLNVGGISTFSDVLYVKVPTAVDSIGSVLNSHLISRFINISSNNAERGLEIGAPSTNVTGPSYLKVYGTTNRFAILDQYDNENLTIFDDVINSGKFGLVGIGSTLPKEKLDVDGNVVPSVDSTYDLGGSSNKWDNVYANTFVGGITGNADTATSLAGGAAGSLPYQSAANTTSFLAEPNANGYVLTYNNTTDAPQWSDLTTLPGAGYTLGAVDSGSNVILRLSDGSTNDDVLITAGTNITIDPVASGGFTISAVADGGGGILSDVDVVQENYGCTNPITTATNVGITTITIGEDSNAYGTRYVQATEPTGVCDGDIWYDTSDAGGGGGGGGSGNPAGTVIYSASSTVPDGYIKANGASLNTTTYADLFAAIGYTYGGSGSSFNAPDLRGEFIRGWDDSRGADSGRTFGSAQAFGIPRMIGGVADSHGNAAMQPINVTGFTNPFYGSGTSTWRSALQQVNTNYKYVYFDSNRIIAASPDVRPRNVALLALIKY